MSRKKPPQVLEGQLDLFAAAPAPAQPPPPPAPVEVEVEGEVKLPEGLRLERNLAILAGAGTGKTYSLVTMCLHLLGGARRDRPPVSCAELGLLTFTEKAADEMRGRLRERLDALAQGTAEEPVLRASFEAAGRPFPPARRWRAIRDELGAATIGTFHSLCTQLLRRAPANAGLSPHFELLEERDARALLRDLVERALLARVEQGAPLRTLVAEIGFERLVDGLVPISSRIREEGLVPDYVQVADGPTLRSQYEAALEAFKARARTTQPTTPKQREKLPEILRVVSRLGPDTFEQELPALRAALANVRGPVGELREAAEEVAQYLAAFQMAPFEAEVREVLVEIAAAHEEALSARGVLDFTGLLVRARDLLRDSLEARAEAHQRFKALLVDEFQDTNRLQLELVLLLSEQREGAPRPVSTAFEAQHQEIVRLPQERGFLAVVGDRKQSIYEFRGADVSVFEVMAQAIEANAGGRAYLRQSRRSTAPLLSVLNTGFAHALGPAAAGSPPADFEVVYQPEHDDLLAVREAAPAGPPVLQLEDSRLQEGKRDVAQQRADDAEAVALAVGAGLGGGWTVVDRREGRERPARGGDVALLFQRFTQLEVYRQALVRHGVRHRVVRGRGFYGAQEIVDLASLLALLADPDDALALSAVLRSPLVGLDDARWVGLARPAHGGHWRLDARRVLFGEQEVPPEVQALRTRYRALRAERERLGLRALVRVVLDTFAYRAAVAASPFGEQALANLDKLLVLAAAREARGVGVAAFAAELLELADVEPREAQGEVVDELDLEAVTLCTVHQAKGLEWPVVVLPDLSVQLRNETAAVRFDREYGLGLVRPRGAADLRSRSAVDIGKQLNRRARAESLRLLYVATTRARDRLVLGLRPASGAGNTWARELDAFLPLRVSGEQPERLDVATLRLAAPEPPPPSTESTAEVRALLSALRAPQRASTAAMVLPVTQLQDLVSCPRRFHFAHQVGLSERPVSFERREDEAPEADDVRARGTAAHKLLELTPLGLLGTPGLHQGLKALRRALGLERLAGDDVLGWVERFWRSDFAASLEGAQVHRELPFALRLAAAEGPSLLLRGQIDLLVVRPHEVLVVDYKASTLPPAGLEPYRFQLGCYALAARRFLGDERPVRAGVVFLREGSAEPRFLPELDLSQVAPPLVAQAAVLVEAQRTATWPGLERPRCEALGCGYVYRCHP